MRIVLAVLLLGAVVSSPVHARGDVVKFEGVQERCVQVGKIKFGPNAKWADCSVSKGRWFATFDRIDFFQAQYCLGKGDGTCDQRAFLIFANRAYTPDAKVILQRFDPGAAEYEDPLVVQTRYGDLLAITARLPDGKANKSYYLWRSGGWKPVDARAWLRDLARQLPKGETVQSEAWPEIGSMSAQVQIAGAGGSGTDGKLAVVELGLAKDSFIVKKVTLTQKSN